MDTDRSELEAGWKAAGNSDELIKLKIQFEDGKGKDSNEVSSLWQTAISLQTSIDTLKAGGDMRHNKVLRRQQRSLVEVITAIEALTRKPSPAVK